MKRLSFISVLLLLILTSAFAAERKLTLRECKTPEDFREFIRALGKPIAGNAMIEIHGAKGDDLKSDIAWGDGMFSLGTLALETVMKSVEAYPIMECREYPDQLWVENFPDAKGLLWLSYADGGKLSFEFDLLDVVHLFYKPPAGPEIEKRNLVWPGSEFLATVLNPLSDEEEVGKRPRSRWRVMVPGP